MNNFYQLLGLASRARKCLTGEDVILNAIRNHRVSLVIVATDASSNTKKRYSDKCQFYNIPHVEIGDKEGLSQAIGQVNRVAVGISDQGFAEGLLAKLTKKE